MATLALRGAPITQKGYFAASEHFYIMYDTTIGRKQIIPGLRPSVLGLSGCFRLYELSIKTNGDVKPLEHVSALAHEYLRVKLPFLMYNPQHSTHFELNS